MYKLLAFLTFIIMKRLSFLLLFLTFNMMIFAQDNDVKFSKSDPYEKLWASVTKYRMEGLPQSAIKVTEVIIEKAKDDRDFASLVRALKENAENRMDVSTDSILPDIQRFESMFQEPVVSEGADAAGKKAILHAFLATVYRSVLNSSLSRTDEEQRAYAKRQMRTHLEQALADKEALALVDAMPYATLFESKGDDSRFYNNDVLSLLLDFTTQKSLDSECYDHPNEAMLAHLNEALGIYRKNGNRNAEVLMQMRVWRTMMSHERRSQRLSNEDFVSRLKSLYEANPDVETGADACIAYYQKAKFGNMKERLDFLRWAKTQWKSNEKAGSFFSTTEKALFDKNVSVAVGGHLSSGIPFPVKVTHRNVPGVKLTIKNEHKKTVLTREVVSADYKDSPDYAEYNITDTVMVNLPPGTYALTAEAAGEKEQTKVFTLSSLKLTCYALPELGSVVCVSDVVTGRPVSKCKVILSRYDYVQGKRKEFKKEVFTDTNGLVYASADGERWTEAKAVRNSDDASNELYIYNYDAHGNDSRLVKFYKLFSDRAIYRPGQTVYVSGYCYKREGDNYQMLAGQELKMRFRDANYQEIAVKDVVTDNFGMAQASFVIPRDRLNGNFSIHMGDETLSIRVEEYKRPTFDIEFEPLEGTLSFGDTVTVKGIAKTYFGVPVQGAKVKVDVTRRNGDFWSFWMNGGVWDKYDSQELETDDDGRFEVKVYLDGDLASDEDLNSWLRDFAGVMRYKVSAQVTDQSGESHENSTVVSVSARDYSLRVGGPDNMDREKLAPLTVSTRNAQGKEVAVTGQWKLERWGVGSDGLVKYEDTGVDGTFESNKEFTIPQLSSMPLGRYRLTATSTDAKGNEYKADFGFVLYSRKGGDIKLSDDWCLTEKRTIDERGVDIYYALAEPEPFVYAYIVSQTKVEKQRIELMDNKIHHVHIDFKEQYKDGVTFYLQYVKNDNVHRFERSFTYVEPEKKLDIAWQTFRDKLRPGQEETWTLTVRHKDGTPAKAQMLATMYDASLDALQRNSWWFETPFSRATPDIGYNSATSGSSSVSARLEYPVTDIIRLYRRYNMLKPFSWEQVYYSFRSPMSRAMVKERRGVVMEEAVDMDMLDEAPAMMNMVAVPERTMAKAAMKEDKLADAGQQGGGEAEDAPQPSMRSNFEETAFFYPDLLTDQDGVVTVSFTLPESLTKWRFMAFAHTGEVDHGMFEATAVASKDFMVQPNMPRFVRTGDQATVATRIINQSEKPVAGTATMRLIDPRTDKEVFSQQRSFSVEAGKTTNASFSYDVPDGFDMLVCEITASDGTTSDGERNWLPVLSDKKFITETVPFYIQGAGTKQVDISTLFNHNSPTAVQRKMVFDYTDTPSWNVVMALHAVMNPENDSAIDWSGSLYVNSVAKHLASRMPKLMGLIRQWESETGQETTLQSELEKNQELKDILLQESPWMLDAQDETEQRHKLCELFNPNLLDSRIAKAKEKLEDLQVDGAWTWFKGMEPSYYTTFAVCDHLSKLLHYFNAVGASADSDLEDMLQSGLSFLDKEELKSYKKYYKEKKNILPSESSLHYMYMCAISAHKKSGNVKDMFDDYLTRVKNRVVDFTMYGRANCAITLQANGRDADALAFVRSLREYTVTKPGMGRYYDTQKAAYSWRDYRIPTHVAAMKAFLATKQDFADADTYLNDMQIWLLRQKQTQKWNSVINTIDAVDLLLTISPDTTFHEPVLPNVKVGASELVISKQTAGVGYSKEIVPDAMVEQVMKDKKPVVSVTKNSPGISWGCVYGQAMESLDRVEANGESLTVARKTFVADSQAEGGWRAVDDKYQFQVGDKVRMRHIISADRDMDFVQVRSQRAACLEPIKTRSGYQMLGGRGGYLAIHDASADFFFDRFRKGTSTIDLEFYVTSPGNYSNGIATVQCAYAPAFAGHSAGSRIQVK